MTSRSYEIKTKHRTGLLTVAEAPDRIDVRLTFDRYGEFGDGLEVTRQMAPLLLRYDRDPRPLHVHAPDLGSRGVVDFDSDGQVVMTVSHEPRQ